MTEQAEQPLAKLREAFPHHQIRKLPKESKRQIEERKADAGKVIWNCAICGGNHHKNAVHLDYVGHAALTDRLLDTDILWTWEPISYDEYGFPAFDQNGGLWIKLTVCGHTRLGYGSADGKTGGDAIKETIGDALRNAAMRFGAALELWHKGELHVSENEETTPKPMSDDDYQRLIATIDTTESDAQKLLAACGVRKELRDLTYAEYAKCMAALDVKMKRAATKESV